MLIIIIWGNYEMSEFFMQMISNQFGTAVDNSSEVDLIMWKMLLLAISQTMPESTPDII